MRNSNIEESCRVIKMLRVGVDIFLVGIKYRLESGFIFCKKILEFRRRDDQNEVKESKWGKKDEKVRWISKMMTLRDCLA